MGYALDPSTGALLVKTVGGGGGGAANTEYTEGDVDATISGQATMWEDAANTLVVVSAAKRLPVELPAGGGGLTDAELRASPVPVSGTFWQATQPVSIAGSVAVTGPLTDAQLRASAVPVSDGGGSITVDGVFFQVTQPVSGTVAVSNFPATQPVSGPLTDAQLRAAVVPVGDGGGSITVDGVFFQATQPVSGTFWQATQPVSGPLTDAQLRASAVPVSGTFWQATQPVSLATNTPDVTDRAARELGRARIWDGTDEATVLPVRTAPATTEKALNVAVLPNRLNIYQAVTAEIAPTMTAIAVRELLAFFHPAAVTQDAYITEVIVSALVTTASTTGGRSNAELFKITSAGTGGTNVAGADVGGGLGTSAIITNAATNVMAVKTGGGALGTAVARRGLFHATQPLGIVREVLFTSSSLEDAIILRGGSADGISVQLNCVAAHTALVVQMTVSIRWIEL